MDDSAKIFSSASSSARNVASDHETAWGLPKNSFTGIFANAPIGIFQFRLDRLLMVNCTFARVFGYTSPEEMLAEVPLSVEFPSKLAVQELRNRDSDQSEIYMEKEVAYHRKDGSPFIADLTIQRIRDPNGEVMFFEGYILDVSEQKRLRQLEELAMLGQKAGKASHDFINIITTSLIHLREAQQDRQMTKASRDTLQELELEMTRAGHLARQFRPDDGEQKKSPDNSGQLETDVGSTLRKHAESIEIKGGSETILLVEDETPMRRSVTRCLRKLGYAVLDAASEEEAHALWAKHHQKIDLLLTDFHLPGPKSGFDLAQQTKSEKTSLQVIICSGMHISADASSRMVDLGFMHVDKPYELAAIAQIVRHCLDGVRG